MTLDGFPRKRSMRDVNSPTVRSPESTDIVFYSKERVGEEERVHIPRTLLFYSARDFTTLEIRTWVLLESGHANEVRAIAHKLGVHRVSVSRALSNLVDHGFATRKNVQYRNPRTGTYELLVYAALSGEESSR